MQRYEQRVKVADYVEVSSSSHQVGSNFGAAHCEGWIHPSQTLARPWRACYQVCDHEDYAKGDDCPYANVNHDSDIPVRLKKAKVEDEECNFDQGATDANEDTIGERTLVDISIGLLSVGLGYMPSGTQNIWQAKRPTNGCQ